MFSSSSHASARTRKALLLAAVTSIGAASAQASVIYWGGGTVDNPANSVDTNSATAANMAGVWNATTLNWNLSSSATTGYQAWSDGNTPYFKMASATTPSSAGIRVELAGDVSASSFTTEVSGSGFNYAWDFISADANNRTVTLGANAIINHRAGTGSNAAGFRRAGLVAGRGGVLLGGSNGFTYNGTNLTGAASGQASFHIETPSPISGDATINSGMFRVGSAVAGGSLLNISNFRVKSSNSALNGITNSSVNVFGDNANIELTNAQFSMQSNGNAVAFNETVGKLTLQGAGWFITDARPGQTASVQSTFNLTNGISRGDNGKGVLTTYSGNNNGGLGASAGIKITGHGIAANSFVPWALNNGKGYNVVTATTTGTNASARFLATDASGNLGVVDSLAGNTDLSTWNGTYTATDNVHIEGPVVFTNALSGGVTINSLAFGNATNSSSATALALNGNQLALKAVGFANPGNAISATVGTNDASRGTLTTPAGTGELYILHQRQNNSATSTFTINPEITGNIDVIFGGAVADIRLTAANTYTGKTFVNGGIVTLNSATASIDNTSELNIARLSTFQTAASNRSMGGGAIAQTLSGGGTLRADSRTFTIGALGVVSPGNAGANDKLSFTLTTGKLSFAAGSVLRIDAGPAGDGDSIAFTGTAGNFLLGSGNWTLDLNTEAGFAYNTPYTVIANTTTDLFAPGTVLLNGTALNPLDYTWSDDGTSYSITVVPEPGMVGVALGVVALAGMRRNRRSA